MRRLLLLLFFYPLFLFSLENDPYELAAFGGEPTGIIAGCVSTITGDFLINEPDIIVNGKEPIVIKRKYFSRDEEEHYGGWEYFFDSLTLTRYWPLEGVPILFIPEKYGFRLVYVGKGKGHHRFVYTVLDGYPECLTNCYAGEIGARLNTKNNRAFDNPACRKEIIVEGADGSTRCYHQFEKNQIDKADILHLSSLKLPNGNTINYRWECIKKVWRLTRISSHSTSGKTYAYINISYIMGDAKHLDMIKFEGSDGQILSYHFDSHVKHGGGKTHPFRASFKASIP